MLRHSNADLETLSNIYDGAFLQKNVRFHDDTFLRKLCIAFSGQCIKNEVFQYGFPVRISSVNVTKSAVFCGFGHIYWKNC